MNNATPNIKHNSVFWVHLLVTTLAWVGPYLFDWRLMVLAYGVVTLQFLVFKKCLMNEHHDLDESKSDDTFYGYLFDLAGWNVPKKPLKKFVRTYLYIILGVWTYVLQAVLHFDPLLF